VTSGVLDPAAAGVVLAEQLEERLQRGGIAAGLGPQDRPALMNMVCADTRSLSRHRLGQGHDSVCDLLTGEGLDCRDERTAAGWAT